MARSILEIDVNDASFKQFHAAFEKYAKVLAAMPKDVKKVSDSYQAWATGMVDVLEDSKKALNSMLPAQERSARIWKEMAKDAKGFASSIMSGAGTLMKWTGVTTLASGLLGIGSLWGMDRFGSKAAGLLKESSGLGASAGSMRSFGLNFEQTLSDPMAFLHAVQGLKTSVQGAGKLTQLTGRDTSGEDTGALSTSLVMRIKDMTEGVPERLLSTIFQKFPALQELPITTEDLQRIQRTSRTDLQAQAGDAASDTTGLRLNEDAMRGWRDFDKALRKAGITIENVLFKGLGPLAGPLGKLSTAFSDAVSVFMTSTNFEGAMKDFGEWIKGVAAAMNGEDFKDNLISFAARVREVGGALVDLILILGKIATKVGGWMGIDVDPESALAHYQSNAAALKASNDEGVYLRRAGQSFTTSTPGTQGYNTTNLRGAGGAFASYKSENEALTATAKQLLSYQESRLPGAYHSGQKAQTLDDFLYTWTPPASMGGDRANTDKVLEGKFGVFLKEMGLHKGDKIPSLRENPEFFAKFMHALAVSEVGSKANSQASIAQVVAAQTGKPTPVADGGIAKPKASQEDWLNALSRKYPLFGTGGTTTVRIDNAAGVNVNVDGRAASGGSAKP